MITVLFGTSIMRILSKLFTYRTLCHVWLLKVIAGIIISLYAVTVTMSHTFATDGPAPSEDSTSDVQPVLSQENPSDTTEAAETPKQQEMKHRQYKLTLLVIIVGIIGLFMVILLITIIRIGRYRHRRLGMGRK